MSRSSKNSSRRPPKQPAESDASKDKDAAWGFGQDEDEETINPRLGLVLTACLLLMFGFVLFSKYQQQTKQVAANLLNGAKSAVSELGEDATEESGSDDKTSEADSTPQTLANSTPTPAEDVDSSFDPFGDTSEIAQASSEPAEPNETSNSFNPFADDEIASSEPPQQSNLPTQAEPSPFFDEPTTDLQLAGGLGNLDLAQSSIPPQQSEVVFDLSATQSEPHSPEPEFDNQFEPVPSQESIAEFNVEPDPFGLAPIPDELNEPVANQSEPAPLESMDLAMPLEASGAEPDPFPSGGFEATPSAPAAQEPDPFGGVATLDEQPTAEPSSELTFPADDWSTPTEPTVGRSSRQLVRPI